MRKQSICKIELCDNTVLSRGWCSAHYWRWHRHGDPCGGQVSPLLSKKFIHDVAGSSTEQCINWPYGTDSDGYGFTTYGGKATRAHRLMCLLINGEPPTKTHEAAHYCGNRKCVNPRHIRWATRADNMADTIIHGTSKRGEKHRDARLSREDVYKIRRLSETGIKQKTIGDMFGITNQHVSAILSGKKWGWLP